MKKSTAVIVCMLVFILGYGQTNLVAGDVIVTGFNSSNPNDEFSFVLLTDIVNGTSINFTDNGWITTGDEINTFRDNEGVVTWTATTDLVCGTEIIIENPIGNNYTATSGAANETNLGFALSANGDQILVYQDSNTSPIFIYAVNFDSAGFSDATSPNNTGLPLGLTDTVNAIDLGEINNANYNCSVVSGQPAILSAVSTSDNWILDDSRITSIGGCGFTCTGCTLNTIWDGNNWNNNPPNINISALINGNYNTITNDSFTACGLMINADFTLNIDNSTFVQIQNDVTVNTDATLRVETLGNFIQVNDASSFTDNGISIVNKVTPPKPEWFFYTYWSSPVSNLNIEDIFTFTPVDRRFGFDAINYLDTNFDGVPSVGGFVPAVTGALTAGIGYAMTENPIGVFPFQRSLDFEGEFNNGEIMIPIQFNPNNVNTTTNMGAHFNFIGNPYPSALDFDAFQSANSTLIDGVAYFWSQASPPEVANNGGSAVNFSQNDYAVYTVGSGGTAGTGTVNPNAPGSTQIPNRFVPSAQGFFVISTAVGSATFNNSMRIDAATDNSSNNNFFGIEQENAAFNTSNSPVIEENRLWINLTSNNGIFNQILVAYVNGATNDYDGVSYDAPRIVPAGTTAVLYTSIDNNDSKFVIQGKAINDIDENEVIPLGFQTNIEVATTYTFSLDSFEGVFIENNTVYLRDELLNVTHNLSASDYSFTSDVGTFTNRFLVQFISSETLSSNEFELTENALTIIELENGVVQFKVSSNLEMETIKIIDLTGRELYNFEVKSNDAIYNLSILKSSVYVAQVTLSNGTVISKKAIKNN